MNLRMKILSGFVILALMLMIAGVWSMWELSKVGVSVKNILDENINQLIIYGANSLCMEYIKILKNTKIIVIAIIDKYKKGMIENLEIQTLSECYNTKKMSNKSTILVANLSNVDEIKQDIQEFSNKHNILLNVLTIHSIFSHYPQGKR